jgi:hypothetical protein
MHRIVSGIHTLEQHISEVVLNPERYRPKCCRKCGKQVMWLHGCYYRQPDRGLESSGRHNPVMILRFICSHCRKTCSRLPTCIPPRRWYTWIVQQWTMLELMLGEPLKVVAERFSPGQGTLRRWMGELREKNDQFRFYLASHYHELERHPGFSDYWQHAIASTGLDNLMATLDNQGVIVP